jgi:hypothetical protein
MTCFSLRALRRQACLQPSRDRPLLIVTLLAEVKGVKMTLMKRPAG